MENLNLVNKMTSINKRPGISEEFGGPPRAAVLMAKIKEKRYSEPFRIQSLNYITRKKESLRIYEDNQKIYGNLKSSRAFLEKSKFEKEH